MRRHHVFHTLAFASALVPAVAPAVAFAAPRDFVVEHSVATDTSTAAPLIAKFLRYAEGKLGWPANSASGEFYGDPQSAAKAIAEKKPGFGMVDPDVLLGLSKKEHLKILASVEGENNLGKLHLVVKDPAIKSVDDLKGKVIVSNHLSSPRFLSKIVFEGKIDVAKHFGKLEEAPGMLKGVKAVDRDQAAATLLSDAEVEAMKASYPNLRVIWSSKELPKMAVVAFAKEAAPKDQEAFAKMLHAMCADAAGGAVCKDLKITKFSAPAHAVYEAAQKRYEQ